MSDLSATEELFRSDHYLARCEATVVAADERGVRLDRTVFYPTGGGQPGDSGTLTLETGAVLRIADTRKGEAPGEILHIPEPGEPLPAPGARVVAAIDWTRRHRLMRMHTCLHLLCAAVPAGVTGGQISDGKGRLDFDTSAAPEGFVLDKDAIEAKVNALVAEDHKVGVRWISDDELAAKPELVRTMSVKPPSGQGRVRLLEIEGVDLQPCGGTHVARTGEIGRVQVVKIESKGKRNKRVILAFEGEG
ncbi:MAG TPA: alanyl-tRNA editing protein [Alphaproteobacteria bacterium]|nr:alanyl-tRNA editing protein [Alphaproteobacteria bacterium]